MEPGAAEINICSIISIEIKRESARSKERRFILLISTNFASAANLTFVINWNFLYSLLFFVKHFVNKYICNRYAVLTGRKCRWLSLAL
jgi:hypothetical protein